MPLPEEVKDAIQKNIREGNHEAVLKNYGRYSSNEIQQRAFRQLVISFFASNPEYLCKQDTHGNTLLHSAINGDCCFLSGALLKVSWRLDDGRYSLLFTEKNLAGETAFSLLQTKIKNDVTSPWLKIIGDVLLEFIKPCIYNKKIDELMQLYLLALSCSDATKQKANNKISEIYRKDQKLLHGKNSEREGNTLLHLAVKFNCLSLCEELLKLDINYIGEEGLPITMVKNKAGQTALEMSLTLGRKDIVSILLQYNATFYMERNKDGIYLNSQYRFAAYLSELLAVGASMSESYLEAVLKVAKRRISSISDISEKREYLDRVAIRLVGLNGDGSYIDFKNWGELYADFVSKITRLCAHNSCSKYGEKFGDSVNYLLVHVRALLSILVINPTSINSGSEYYQTLIKELLLAINTAKIDQETSLLQISLHREDISDLRKSHCIGLQSRLNHNQIFCYPAGWPGASDNNPDHSGHAIYINIRKISTTDVGLEVCNLGGGIDASYNKQLIIGNDLVLPAIMRADIKYLESYLDGLIWANLYGDADENVARALRLIYSPNIFGDSTKTLASKEYAEVMQEIGNCIVKNYLFAMRIRIGGKYYRSLYLQMLNGIVYQEQSYGGINLPEKSVIIEAIQSSQYIFRLQPLTSSETQQLISFKTSPKNSESSKKDTDDQVSSVTASMQRLRFLSSSSSSSKPVPTMAHRGQVILLETEEVVPSRRAATALSSSSSSAITTFVSSSSSFSSSSSSAFWSQQSSSSSSSSSSSTFRRSQQTSLSSIPSSVDDFLQTRSSSTYRRS